MLNLTLFALKRPLCKKWQWLIESSFEKSKQQNIALGLTSIATKSWAKRTCNWPFLLIQLKFTNFSPTFVFKKWNIGFPCMFTIVEKLVPFLHLKCFFKNPNARHSWNRFTMYTNIFVQDIAHVLLFLWPHFCTFTIVCLASSF